MPSGGGCAGRWTTVAQVALQPLRRSPALPFAGPVGPVRRARWARSQVALRPWTALLLLAMLAASQGAKAGEAKAGEAKAGEATAGEAKAGEAENGDGGISLAPVEVTWQRPAWLETVAPVEVVEPTPEDVRAGKTVADLLEELPGFQVVRSGSSGQGQSVTLRGGNTRQVTVLLEGIPLDDPGSGAVDLSLLPLEAVEAVEVYRGSSGSRAGSGAMGGAVVIRLRRGGRTEYVERLTSGFYGPATPDGGGGSFSVRRGGLFLHYGHQTRLGEFPFVDTNGAERTRTNNGATSDNVVATWRKRLTRDVRLDLLGSLSLVHRGSPGIEQFPSADGEESRDNALVGARLKANRFPVDGADLRGGLSYGLWRWRFADPEPYLGPAVDNVGHNHRLRSDLGGGIRAATWLDIGWELAHRSEWMNRAGTADPSSHDRHLVDGLLSASLGARDLPVEGMAALKVAMVDVGEVAPLPTVEVGWRLHPALRLAASGGRAFRVPSFDEMYFQASGIRGNPELEPEDSWSAELGLQLRLPRFSAELAGFGQWFDESILFLPVSPYLVEAQNTGRVSSFGAEAAASSELGPLTLAGTFTWLEATLDESGTRLPLKSRFSGSLSARLRFWRCTAYLSGLFRSPFTLDRFEARDEEHRLLLDAGLSVDLGAGFHVALDGRNLLDKRDMLDAFQYPLPGLSWHVSVEHRWQGGNE